jgi:hypothetical protein
MRLIIFKCFYNNFNFTASDEVEKCGALVTLNNTYWQAPAAVSSGSSCGLTVKLDENLVEQKKAICQIR